VTNRSKRKGTSFETACVRFLRGRLQDDRIERRALHGSRDMGDLYGLRAHGFEGIAECKDHAQWGPADLARWREQTVAERGNADADFSLLVIHKAGVGGRNFGRNICQMQVRDLMRVMGGEMTCLAGETAMDVWVQVDLEAACQMIEGVYDAEQ